MNSAIDILKSFDTKLSFIASTTVVNARQTVCNSCSKRKLGTCLACGCILLAKTRLATEKCPLGKWKK